MSLWAEKARFGTRPPKPRISYFPCLQNEKEINTQKGNIGKMKTVLLRTVQLMAVLIALALPALAEESKRGFFEGDLAGGGKIVFFVQGNHAVSAYFFDVAGMQSGFAGGGAGHDGRFTLHTRDHETITGTIGTNSITARFQNQTITANLVPVFGPTENIAGRYS